MKQIIIGAFLGLTSTLSFAQKKIAEGARADINRTTSYNQQSTVPFYDRLPFSPTITLSKANGYLAWAYADFDRDSDIDILTANVNWTPEGEPMEYWENRNGKFVSNPSVFGDAPPFIQHGRKAIVADVDGNGWPDAIMAGHGYDIPPFKGEPIRVFLNSKVRFKTREISLPAGFFHSVCAGDIDHDGDIDLFITDAMMGPNMICKFLRNDGAGNFTHDPSLFPEELRGKFLFTSELYDIDADGFLDLVVAGHEAGTLNKDDGAETRVLWGSATGRYTVENSTILPPVNGYGVVLDIDFVPRTEGGFEILLNRTGDPYGPMGWYRGFYIQLVSPVAPRVFEDFSISRMRDNMSRTGPWITWLRVHDINKDGKLDITSENKQNQQEWLNTSGVFKGVIP
jgi:hypothetical protein